MPRSTIAHYRIDSELGRGGMGVVYEAFDRKLRRKVAIKVLQEAVVGEGEQRRRILSEARAASPLNHPSVATIYEVGEEDGLLFIVMEFVSGVTLRQEMKHKKFRPQELAILGSQICAALEAAHDHNVVHGDIKPENIVIQDGGGIKLLDFGVARSAVSEAATATLDGTALVGLGDEQFAGTLAYVSPERLKGEWADPRSDLFSVGVLLHEIVSGHRPFPGPDPAGLAAQILNLEVPRLDSKDSSVPSELARIVHKLLEKDPNARYQSAREVKVDLINLERDVGLGATLSAAVSGRRTVAVLPFKLLTPNPDDEYLSLALADALISGLSINDHLLLRPSSSVMRYARERVDPLVAGRELNVEIIIEGSIQKVGPKLRAHVQVWDVATGATLLSVKHDAEVTDLFGLQDQIAESLSATLGIKAGAPESAPTENPQAYELYLRAVDRLSLANRWDTRTAIEMLRAVTVMDPLFAEAWALLGHACVMMAFTFEPVESWYRSADEAIERALELDASSVAARVAKGRILWSPDRGFQNRPALRILGEALRLSPHSHLAVLWQSLIFMHVGLLERAQHGLTEALAMRPDDAFALNFMGQTLEFMGDYEAAADYQQRALAVDPSHLFANLFQASALVRMGELDRAQRSVTTAEQFVGVDSMLLSHQAMISVQRGDAEAAERGVERALAHTDSVAHTHHTWHGAAAVYSQLGKPEAAIDCLSRASEIGLPNYPLFRDDPLLLPLKEEPGYRELMTRLKADWDSYRDEFLT